MNKTVKWILISVLIIVLAVVVYYLVKASQQPSTQPPGPPAPPGGPGTDLANILGGLFSGNWWKNLFGGSPKVVDCDPARPGYEKDGTPNANCGKDYTGCDINKCDLNRPGWNQCGFPDTRC